MKGECLVTIITPVFNGEKYLDRYFENIDKLTYRNLQIIVVNDGSADASAKKISEYASQDRRILFLDKHINEGVSCARNDALDNAKGKFIFMFDCDDTFEPDIISSCINTVKSDTETVAYNYASVRRSGDIAKHEFSYAVGDYSGKEIVDRILPHSFGTSIEEVKEYLKGRRTMRQGKELNGPWRLMYSKEVIDREHIRFDKNLKVGEDTVFTNEYLALSETVYAIDKVLYYLHNNDDSTIDTYNRNVQRMIDGKLLLIEAKTKLSNRLLKRGIKTEKLWGGEYVLSSVQIGWSLAQCRDITLKEKCALLRKYHDNNSVKKIWCKISTREILECKSIKAVPVLFLKANMIWLTECLMCILSRMGFKM